jgi:tetratricopeptide (TPR) repeat protein
VEENMKIKLYALAGLLFFFTGMTLAGQNSNNSTEAARYIERGNELSDKGDFQGAIESYTQAIRLNPVDDTAYLYRGLVYAATGNDDAAIADYSSAIKLNPRRPSAYFTRADIYGRKGESGKAIADYTQVIALNPNFPDSYGKRALQFQAMGNFDAAIADYDKAIRLKPNEPSYYNSRGSILFDIKRQTENALADFTMAIRCDPKNAFAYFSRATIYAEKGERDNALADFARALRLNPGDIGAYNNRGFLYIDTGEFDAAISDFNNVLKIDPNTAEAYNGLGTAYAKKGEYDRAITYYTQSLRLQPNYRTYSNRGLAYYNKGEYLKAVEDYTLSINLTPSAITYSNRGNAYDKLKQYDKAISDFDRAIALDPAFMDAYVNRASTYSNKGDRRRAIKDLTEIIRLNPDNAVSYSNRAIAYAELGEYAAAITDYTHAIRLDPYEPLHYANRGVAYRATNQPGKALADYEKCLEVANRNVDINIIFKEAWRRAGFVYEQFPRLNDTIRADDFFMKYADIARRGVSMGIRRAENLRTVLGARGSDIMVRQLYLYYAGVDLEAKFGSAEKAFEYSESLRSRDFLAQASSEAALRLPGVNAEERRSVQTLTARTAELRETLNSLSEHGISESSAAQKYADAGIQLSETEKQLAALDAKIGQRIPRYAELRNPKPVDIARAKAWCGNDRAVLEYVLWDNSVTYSLSDPKPAINSYCLILTQNGVIPVRLDPGFDYAKAVNDLRGQIINDTNLSRGLSVISPSAQGQFEQTRNNLYNKLIKPVLPHIPANIKNIVIVPDGPLMYLPFDVLRESADKPDFGETFRLSLSPSVSVSVLAAKTGARAYEPLLALGGAVYDRNNAQADRGKRGYTGTTEGRGLTVEESALDGGAGKYYGQRLRWFNLPGTEAEVKGLQNLSFSRSRPTIFTGKDVSEKKVKELSAAGTLKTYPVIHFACHGYFNEEAPAMSSIVLSEVSGLTNTGEDGYLTIPEIILLDMDARMVVLSACETGLGQVKRGDGMVGLVRSFLVAGAENVGVSLWSISDEATVEFMTRLYRKVIEQRMNFRDAYFVVRGEFRRDPKWSHPFYWAAFTMYE